MEKRGREGRGVTFDILVREKVLRKCSSIEVIIKRQEKGMQKPRLHTREVH